MNSYLDSFHLNMTSDEPNDSVHNFSHASNRSRMLLDEMASSPSKFGNKSLLFKTQPCFPPLSSQTPWSISVILLLLLTSFLTNLSFYSICKITKEYKEEQQQSSIYTQFKLDTNRFIDEDFNLNDLLKSYANICEEQSHFIHEKLQRLSNMRQK